MNRSQTSTGLMDDVVGKLLETERYTEVRTIMQVMFAVSGQYQASVRFLANVTSQRTAHTLPVINSSGVLSVFK